MEGSVPKKVSRFKQERQSLGSSTPQPQKPSLPQSPALQPSATQPSVTQPPAVKPQSAATRPADPKPAAEGPKLPFQKPISPSTSAPPIGRGNSVPHSGGLAAGVEGPGAGRTGGESVEEKIERYDKFVDQTLRVKLQEVCRTPAQPSLTNIRAQSLCQQVVNKRGDTVGQIESYEKLKGSVELLIDRKANHVKSMVNIGCDVYMQASIPDTSRIIVDIGLGFYAEFALEEAVKFINKKVEVLQAKADSMSSEAAGINAQIEVVLKGIQELMQIPEEERQDSKRHFL